MTKRRARILLACIAGGAVAAATWAPAAHADDNSFLNDVYNLGFNNNPSTLLKHGWAVCEALNTNNGTQVAEYLYFNSDYTVSHTDAALFVLSAVDGLCPWQSNRNGATV